MTMHIWVFSYNRGIFLRNCIESIERCAPMCPVTVFDDNSTDPDTQAILESIAKKHRVMKPKANVNESKHGGLYANMQSAFESMPDGELMCFLQDDTQLVRAVTEEDMSAIRNYFEMFSDAGFIQPAFMRGSNKATDYRLTRYESASEMYFVDRFGRAAGAYYSDIFVADVERLRRESWTFRPRESYNELQAKAKFRQLAYLPVPFAAWLPNVPAFRGKVRTWSMRRAERLSDSGFYPIRIMSDDEVDRFFRKKNVPLPYAEDFLTLRRGSLRRPWNYYPLQNHWWLKRLNHLETFLSRKFGH